MNVLVTGASGQLGRDVCTELYSRGVEVIGCDLRQVEGAPYRQISIDLTDESAVNTLMEEMEPNAVIHCAAWTAVDAAEEADNRSAVYAANVRTTRNLAEACRQIQAKMLYISTDYVFSGEGTKLWQPEDACNHPLNVYGETKLAGERVVKELLERYFIVRTSWLFGVHGGNFVNTMLRAGEKYGSLRVVCDQIGTPTYTVDLARLLADMIETERYGVYHASNTGRHVSWYEFACEIFRQCSMTVAVQPVTTAAYGLSKAKRPMNSRLDLRKLTEQGFAALPDWRDALRRYLEAIRR